MVKRGERPIAVAASVSYAIDAMAEGHKLDSVYPKDGTFLVASPTGVIKGSPNPNAAKAFAEFMLSRTVQELFPQEHLYSARTDVAGPDGSPPLSAIKIHPVDYDYIESDSTRIKRRFSEVLQ